MNIKIYLPHHVRVKMVGLKFKKLTKKEKKLLSWIKDNNDIVVEKKEFFKEIKKDNYLEYFFKKESPLSIFSGQYIIFKNFKKSS